MIMFLVVVGTLLLVTADIMYLTRKPPECVLPISFCVICVWEYVFALLNSLVISVSLFYVVLGVWNILLVCKKRVTWHNLSSLFTPGVIFYILCGLIFWIFYTNRITRGGDEYSAWASTVKHVFYYGNVPAYGVSNVQIDTYIPGAALVKYFFMKIQGVYTDNLLYRIHSLWILSFVVPVFAWREYSKSGAVRLLSWLLKGIICVLLPGTFFVACYSSLMVDCLMCVSFAYGFALIYTQKHDRFFYVLESLICAELVLVKEAGFVLAGIIILGLILDEWGQNGLKKAMSQLWTAGSALLPYITWKIYLHIFRVRPEVDINQPLQNLSIQPFVDLFQGNVSSLTLETVGNFFQAFFKYGMSNVYEAVLPIPGIGFFAIVVGLVLMLANTLGKKRTLGMLGTVLLGILAYYTMLLYTYIYVMKDSPYVLRLPSYNRYTMALWAGLLMGLMMSRGVFLEVRKERVKILLDVTCICWIALSMWYLISQNGHGYVSNAQSIQFREMFTRSAEEYGGHFRKGERVYIVVQDNGELGALTTGGIYLMAQYLLTPGITNPQTSNEAMTPTYTLGESAQNNNSAATDYTLTEWETILQDYDYLYLCITNKVFEEKYGALFLDEIENDTLYAVDVVNDGIILKKAEVKQ